MPSISDYNFEFHAPAGYYVACRMGFVAPFEEYNNYPEEWIRIYTDRGFMLYDPVIRWAYENTGHCRWSDLDIEDTQNVMSLASNYGLQYGITASFRADDVDGQRTLGSFARSDREFTDEEIDILYQGLIALHENNSPPSNLTKAELEVLSLLKRGLLMKEIAAVLGVSESAIKARLKNAKLKLSAKTNTHATSIASDFGLI